MNKQAWKNHGYDSLFNGSLIAAGIVGLLLAVIDGPAPQAPQLAKALVVSEAKA